MDSYNIFSLYILGGTFVLLVGELDFPFVGFLFLELADVDFLLVADVEVVDEVEEAEDEDDDDDGHEGLVGAVI